MNTPTDLLYAKTHEWLRQGKEGGTVGITDYAQSALGDVVFIELPKTGRKVVAGEVVATRPSYPEAGTLAYAALAHPALFPEPGTIVLSVSRNSSDTDAVSADPTLYRPEFFRVPLP